jgi:hypothetical protein
VSTTPRRLVTAERRIHVGLKELGKWSAKSLRALEVLLSVLLSVLSVALLSVVISTIVVMGSFLALTLPSGSPFLLLVPLLAISIIVLAVAMGIQLTLFPGASWIYSVLIGFAVGAIDAALMQVRVSRRVFYADWSSRLFVVTVFVISALICWGIIRNWGSAEDANA